MTTAQLKLVSQGECATLYTIQFNGEDLAEFQKFIEKFKDNATLQRDYQIIMRAISEMLARGAFERYFRPEGKMSDNVCALPIYSGKLRLYCIRLSDKILVAGNGGIKNTKTYQDSEELKGYVMDLQKFDNLIKVAVKQSGATVEETIIQLEDKPLEL